MLLFTILTNIVILEKKIYLFNFSRKLEPRFISIITHFYSLKYKWESSSSPIIMFWGLFE